MYCMRNFNERIRKIIQSRTQTQNKIAKDIIQLFNNNSSNSIHTYLYCMRLTLQN